MSGDHEFNIPGAGPMNSARLSQMIHYLGSPDGRRLLLTGGEPLGRENVGYFASLSEGSPLVSPSMLMEFVVGRCGLTLAITRDTLTDFAEAEDLDSPGIANMTFSHLVHHLLGEHEYSRRHPDKVLCSCPLKPVYKVFDGSYAGILPKGLVGLMGLGQVEAKSIIGKGFGPKKMSFITSAVDRLVKDCDKAEFVL